MSKWTRDEKIFLSGLISIVVVITTLMINCVFSSVISSGEVYEYHYTHCVQWQSAYKSQQCVRYVPAKELRRDVQKKGLFWNYQSYEIVH